MKKKKGFKSLPVFLALTIFLGMAVVLQVSTSATKAATEAGCIDPTGISLNRLCGAVGEPVTITANGTDPALRYKFFVGLNSYCDAALPQNWMVLQDWGSGKTYTYTPAAEGRIIFVVWTAKDINEPCTGIAGVSYEVSGSSSGSFTITSSAFQDGQAIPTRYAHTGVPGGLNVSLPLTWENAPAGTVSFALAMVDRHPVADNWVHWLVINIPSTVSALSEGASRTAAMPAAVTELFNSFGTLGYGGPEPPAGTGAHDYEITLYALNVSALSLNQSASLFQFEQAIQGKVLGSCTITGTYAR